VVSSEDTSATLLCPLLMRERDLDVGQMVTAVLLLRRLAVLHPLCWTGPGRPATLSIRASVPNLAR
jgi:hypothetical protein